MAKSNSKSAAVPTAPIVQSAGLAAPAVPAEVHPAAVPTLARVLKFAESFAEAFNGAERSAADLAEVLAARYPSKGNGKARVPKPEAVAVCMAGKFEAVRLRGLLAFGDWLHAGNKGTETDFRRANAALNAKSRKASGKAKSGRKAKSGGKAKAPATPAAAADAIVSILRGFKSPDRVAILTMVREALTAAA